MTGFPLSRCLQARDTFHSPPSPPGKPGRWDPSPGGWLQGAQLLPQGLSAPPRPIFGPSLLAESTLGQAEESPLRRSSVIPCSAWSFCHPTASAALSWLRWLLLAPPKQHPAPAAPVPPQQPLTPQGHAHCDLCHCPQALGPSDCRGTVWRPNSSSSNQF